MSDSEHQSVSLWIASLKSGDDEAAKEIWERYATLLTRMARRKLGQHPRRVADEDDVAVSVFFAFCNGAKKGSFRKLDDRDDLWKLLVVITQNKIKDQMRRDGAKKRNGGRQPTSIHECVIAVPTQEDVAGIEEEFDHLLNRLHDEQLKRIAVMLVQGKTKHEIAIQENVVVRTIERKRELIKKIWLESLDE